ncbi:DUF881 domain-containing protein [Bacillus sp. CGMCC 1.16607]|uniref:DUF881 domain-containing protein n=1 Tax=Bacillus sp. CGMCC 1.16607 TaxID=3351842 RepID=UPI00364166C6
MITLVIGFMIAIQFQTVQKPVVRDTRDVWQLREDLLKEKEIQSKLIREIRSNDEKIASYETTRRQSKEQVLRDTLEELKREAGLTPITGPGIILKVEPIYEDIVLGEPLTDISPELLQRLLNELNMYEAKFVAIDGNRIINTTVIRDINGETKIDGNRISQIPFEVRVVVENMEKAEKLYNRMQVSKSMEEFFIDNLKVSVTKPLQVVSIPAYSDTIRVRFMEPIKADKGGS